jgi:hypothetical protein
LKAFVDFIYSVLIGLAVVFFVGFGLWAFLSSPKYPDSPPYRSYPTAPVYPAYNYTYEAQQAYTEKQKVYEEEIKAYDAANSKDREEFNKKLEDHNKADKNFNTKMATISLVSGLVFYLCGLYLLKNNSTIGEGLALGGIFVDVYAGSMALMADNKKFVFGIVAAQLAMIIVLVLQRQRKRQTK